MKETNFDLISRKIIEDFDEIIARSKEKSLTELTILNTFINLITRTFSIELSSNDDYDAMKLTGMREFTEYSKTMQELEFYNFQKSIDSSVPERVIFEHSEIILELRKIYIIVSKSEYMENPLCIEDLKVDIKGLLTAMRKDKKFVERVSKYKL